MAVNGVESSKKGLDLERVRGPGLTEISGNDSAPINRSQDTVLLNISHFPFNAPQAGWVDIAAVLGLCRTAHSGMIGVCPCGLP